MLIGLEKITGGVKKSSENVGDTVIQAMKNSLSKVADVLDTDIDLSPTISPVIDISNIEKGLTGAFSKQYSLDADASIQKAELANVSKNQNGFNLPSNQQTIKKFLIGLTYLRTYSRKF